MHALTTDYQISPIIKGNWHLAGGHGSIEREQALNDMADFVDAGVTTFDMADIYTGVEELVGSFRRAYPTHAARLQIHTKYVPDLQLLAQLTSSDIEATIDRSLSRLGVERIDLVQFHWWDYMVPGYLEALGTLNNLRQKGKIRCLGLTNFDTDHVREIVDAGIPIASHQVQYSLLDERPGQEMVGFCKENDIQLLCYGTVAGGFFSERYLDRPEPALEDLTNRSLIKYKLILDDAGGWDFFQRLLRTLHEIAQLYHVSIATLASAYILQKPGVAAVIVGATNVTHLEENVKIPLLKLSDAEHMAIEHALQTRQELVGDCYTLERDREGRHGRIMRYNLNKS